MATPPFSLAKPRYDQSSFSGRLNHFLGVVDPRLLFVGSAEVQRCKELLHAWEAKENGSANEMQLQAVARVSDADLWYALKVKQGIVHPDTQESVPLPFRMSAFVPVNIPIVAGLMTPNPTVASVVFFQWLNQSYNVAVNYANRNASSEMTNRDIGIAYSSATATSLTIALGLRSVSQRVSFGPALGIAIPWLAVAGAGTANVFLMRGKEMTEGIPVKNADGDVVGVSKKAGRQALVDTALSRAVFLPVVPLLLPPVLMNVLNKTAIMRSNPRLKLPVELAVITTCLWGALPPAIAIFPQERTIATSKLEKEFQDLRLRDGGVVTELRFNKGL